MTVIFVRLVLFHTARICFVEFPDSSKKCRRLSGFFLNIIFDEKKVNDESKNTFESARHSVIYNNQNDMIPSQSVHTQYGIYLSEIDEE